MLTSGARSAGDEAFAKMFDPPHYARFTRCALDSFVRKGDQFARVKTRRKAFQALRGDRPIAVAPGSLEQVKVPIEAFAESCAQFGGKCGVLASSRGKRRIE